METTVRSCEYIHRKRKGGGRAVALHSFIIPSDTFRQDN